jgi:hypothetical protein
MNIDSRCPAPNGSVSNVELSLVAGCCVSNVGPDLGPAVTNIRAAARESQVVEPLPSIRRTIPVVSEARDLCARQDVS